MYKENLLKIKRFRQSRKRDKNQQIKGLGGHAYETFSFPKREREKERKRKKEREREGGREKKRTCESTIRKLSEGL